MTTDEFPRFASQLIHLGELYDASFSEAKLILYFEALKDLPLETVGAGLLACAKSCTFMPKPAEIRNIVVGDSEDEAEQAWQIYKRTARLVGGYGSPTLTDVALAETLVAVFGSWEQACWMELSPEMWASKRKEFGRVYRAIKQRGLVGQKQLEGFVDRENAARGFLTSEAIAGQDTEP